MAKKRKWDGCFDFDDWKDNSDSEQKEESHIVEETKPREIHGTGINRDEETVDLFSFISGLNAQNKDHVEELKETEKSNAEEQRSLEQQREEEERAAKARAQFEREQAEKEARLFAEAEAEAKRVSEELKKKENSLLNRASKAFFKRPTEKSAPEAPPPTEESKPEDLNDSGNQKEPTQNPDMDGASSAGTPISLTGPPPDKQVGKTEGRREKRGFRLGKAEREREKPPKQKGIEEAPLESVEVERSPLPGKREAGSANEPSDAPVQEKEGKGKGFPLFKKRIDRREKEDGKEKPSPPETKKADMRGKSKPPKEKETDWRYLATHDEMTGLWNRTAYEQEISKERSHPFAVIYIDINDLKFANDTMGHKTGDILITEVAKQIDWAFPECGYRIGGDEFVVVLDDIKLKKAEDMLDKECKDFHKALEQATEKTAIPDLVISASFGYAYSSGDRAYSEVAKEAEKQMYKEKELHKKAHPNRDVRQRPPKQAQACLPARQEDPAQERYTADRNRTNPENYDDGLTKEQQSLKASIRGAHAQVSPQSTQGIVREIQQRSSEVVAILIASPTFDHLFIVQTAKTFVDIMMESDCLIDYSYLYIIYQKESVYKGADEYLPAVTDLFTAIGRGLSTGKIRSEKDLLKVKGINIFKNIYVDA